MLSKQEELVIEAFSKQSETFDEDDLKNPILIRMRNEIRQHVLSLIKPESTMLELNSGTGLDAVYFSEHGINVTATDISMGMIRELEKKILKNNLQDKIKVKQCSFNNLEELKPQKFDYIFSNFGGLNCADDLKTVINQLDELLNPGGIVTLVLMPPICLWELLFVFKGNFKLAFRRFKRNGADSHLEGVYFKTYYYFPRSVKKKFGKGYVRIKLKGLRILSPPPFMNKFYIKYPRVTNSLNVIDMKICKTPILRFCADHYIISLKKNQVIEPS